VVAYESGVADVADPLGGSFTIERLTDAIEAGAVAYIRKIDDMGGMVRAIEGQFPQKEIADAAYRHQRTVESGGQVVVGVNKFTDSDEARIPIHRLPPDLERDQIARVRDVRARRDNGAVERALARVTEAARGTENLLYPILDAVRALATVGEISDAMRAVFGEYRPG
jgi:methylmalonyl-CoA mutase N-terminal domain/subunit